MFVLIKGAGDIATGVAHRLHRSGIRVVMTELEAPTSVRRPVSFSQCMFDGVTTVEGVTARRASGLPEVRRFLDQHEIPVLHDPECAVAKAFPFTVIVDAIFGKCNNGTGIDDAPIVIALGPHFTAGIDCNAVVDTVRGQNLGRILLSGKSTPDNGIPKPVDGFSVERVVTTPVGGLLTPLAQIGQIVMKDEPIAQVGETIITAQLDGMVRGMLPAGFAVSEGMRIGDVDPRRVESLCYTISDKARSVGGGVLEAVFYLTKFYGAV